MNDDLLIKFLLDEADTQEQQQVRLWIEAHPDNRHEFERFQTIWLESKSLKRNMDADPEQAWDKFKKRVSRADEVKIIPVRKSLLYSGWLKIAAVLFIAAGSWMFYSFYYTGFSNLNAEQMVLTETLPDGSEVVLNRNTKLSYQRGFHGEQRRVRLDEGEAFFKVSPDKNKPFVIEAAAVTVRVLGTSFNVKKHTGETEVIVETGLVRVSLEDESVDLRPGEKAVIKKGQKSIQKELRTDLLYQFYRNRVLVADNTPLWRVVQVLNEVYGSNIVIENSQVAEQRYTTTFKDDELDNILHVIAETFKITVVKEGGKIILR